jgi:hypothetical protein
MRHFFSVLNAIRENTKFSFQEIDESVADDPEYLEKSAIVSIIQHQEFQEVIDHQKYVEALKMYSRSNK